MSLISDLKELALMGEALSAELDAAHEALTRDESQENLVWCEDVLARTEAWRRSVRVRRKMVRAILNDDGPSMALH